ncbi:glycosyltransferase [Thalassotalea euphylliae]|uniref:Glycosyltransferase n=1 Tax=Thalassotalea euphylliae TaxID=1655234 RepID=A0A3E0TWZ2_9GAMM|nr:glycosyltransferase family 4 protein [Thalassotalea euphylliae]REL28442.1 glycosyltransferase [Thalassotalea euphylliae]
MKSLLIIGWVWPEPNSSAAGSRMVQLIRLFQMLNYHITFASPAQKTDHMMDLSHLTVDVQEITLNCDSFDNFVCDLNPDAVMYDRYMMEEQFGWRVAKHCPDALRILDTEDLQSLRNARHQAYKRDGHLDDTSLTTELAIREVAAIYRCDLTIMISPAEIDLLKTHYQVPESLLCYLPFLYTDKELSRTSAAFSERAHFVSIGNFRHAPNWDSVLWLKQQIWPKVRKVLPQAQLHIYGAYPPKKATDLHCEKSGFLVKGWADDAFEVMSKARVCLAPLRFGAGIKGKLSDAMLCGTPSVTTAIGVEGMTTELDWAGEVAETVDDLAQAAISLYQDEDKWLKASALAKQNRHLLFHHEPFVQQFRHQLTELANNLAEHRQANFIGLMLNHHSHKSTQYMSQWIAAKNRLAD